MDCASELPRNLNKDENNQCLFEKSKKQTEYSLVEEEWPLL